MSTNDSTPDPTAGDGHLDAHIAAVRPRTVGRCPRTDLHDEHLWTPEPSVIHNAALCPGITKVINARALGLTATPPADAASTPASQGAMCGSAETHGPHPMPCDSGCQPDWHRDSCAIYGRCSGLSTPASEGLTEVEREAGLSTRELARELRATWRERTIGDGYDPLTAEGDAARTVAGDVLRSDWLRERVADAEAKAHAKGHREGYEMARSDMLSGALIGGPTYEALRGSFTGQRIIKDERERIAQAIEDVARKHPNHPCDCRGCSAFRYAARIARGDA